MMDKKCYIFGAGEFYGLWRIPTPDDLILAADGGFRYCEQLGITPDLLMGDFDSMEQPDFPHILRFPVEKDDTDTMLAVKEGLKQGCTVFYLYGCTGGDRPDHTFANVQSLLYLRRRGARGYLYDKGMTWTVVENGGLEIPAPRPGAVLSVFPMDGAAEDVILSGVQYPMIHGTLSPDFPLGVGNHFTADTALVYVRYGALLIGIGQPNSKG